MRELEEELNISPLPPVAVGGVLVVPVGMLRKLQGADSPPDTARNTKETELIAMQAVLKAEEEIGYSPRDVGVEKIGYDVESTVPRTGKLRFLEVKGRISGARIVTVTKNEILTALNKPESYYLAMVEVENGIAREIRYVRNPFGQKPDFGVTSVNYNWDELWKRGVPPRETRE